MSIFDGLPDIFVATFGEAVVYTPVSTGVPLGADGTISAIWRESSGGAPFQDADTDIIIKSLHVRASDVADPQEGDLVRRVATNEVRKVSPPIRPDGKGMITVDLVRVS